MIGSAHKKACLLILATSAFLCAFSPSARANERQYKIEAAFLYNFFNYITWPGYASPEALKEPLICIYGNDPVIGYLDYVRHKMSPGRILTVRLIQDGQPTTDCHLFFMRHRIPYRMTRAMGKATLTVLKPDDPLDRGGMIELTEDGERIAMRINQDELDENGFQASSRLLELAQRTR